MALESLMAAARQMPQHIQAALDALEGHRPPSGPFDDAVVVGMGGSSIGGALAARLLERDADVPIHVLRGSQPPGFVDERTFVLATSYSGTTDETLEATRAAVQAGATVAAVTTGGTLGDLVDRADGPVVDVPTGYQPRAAIGWLLTANHALLSRALDVGDPSTTLEQAAKPLADEMETLSAAGGPADQLASALGEGAIGVVGHDLLGTVARRWAGELAENSKRLAFHAELPEAAHNQIVGWAGHPGDVTLVLVRRDAAEETPRERVRLDHLAESARDAGAPVVEARLGATGLAGVLRGLLLGDLVSLHLARRERTDPEPVDAIEALKDRLADADA